MKKFRIMLPMLALVFAVVGAVAGDLMPGIQAYRLSGFSCIEGVTEQDNCAVTNDNKPVCTILVGESEHVTAYQTSCSGTNILRQQPNP